MCNHQNQKTVGGLVSCPASLHLHNIATVATARKHSSMVLHGMELVNDIANGSSSEHAIYNFESALKFVHCCTRKLHKLAKIVHNFITMHPYPKTGLMLF
jgi:hypothetical protein